MRSSGVEKHPADDSYRHGADRKNFLARVFRYGFATCESYWVCEEIDLFFSLHEFPYWEMVRLNALVAARRGEDVRYCLVARGMTPKGLALECIKGAARSLLSSGKFHIVRNELSGEGKSYRSIFERALSLSVTLGMETEEAAESATRDLDTWIASIG
jgi:hypothetical protein